MTNLSKQNQSTTLMSVIKYGFDATFAKTLRSQYQQQGYLLLNNFFDSFVAEHFQGYFKPENLKHFFEVQYGAEYNAGNYEALPDFIKEYNFLINQKNYIEFLEAITGCGHIGQMKGHAYVSDKNQKRGYGFHSDNDGNRHFLVSINITPAEYIGGEFTMRNSVTKKELFKVHNSGSYSALIAPINDELEHAVSDVQGDVTRLTLLSWAMKTPTSPRFSMY